jgi:hypothetical protein
MSEENVEIVRCGHEENAAAKVATLVMGGGS